MSSQAAWFLCALASLLQSQVDDTALPGLRNGAFEEGPLGQAQES